ncbi:MAG: hypothetical protein IJV37_01980 [Bacteroidales bacterium]|nr:hypothetical protein [Bacteroidales bacterium]
MNRIFPFIALCALLSGCVKETLDQPDTLGKYDPVVHFGLGTAEETGNTPDTKTAYSGTVGTDKVEQINWTAGDQVRIISNESMTADGKTSADYTVDLSLGAANGIADAKPVVEGETLYWNDASRKHYFFSLYPAPQTNAATGAATEDITMDASGEKAVVQGTIPDVQTYTSIQETDITGGGKEYEFLPDMSKAYMAAAACVAPENAGTQKVTLKYTPLFTAFRFSFYAADDKAKKYTVTRVELRSDPQEGHNLSGVFTADLEYDASQKSGSRFTVTDTTAARRSVAFEIPASEQRELGTDRISFTLLTLPVEQKHLTVDITFLDGNDSNNVRHRRLHMQNKGTGVWYAVPATNKLYVNSGLQDIQYYFEVTQNLKDEFDVSGTSLAEYYTVRSYREYDDRSGNGTTIKQPVNWTAVEYYYDYKWTTAPPSWLDDGVLQQGPGSDDSEGEKRSIKVGENTAADDWNSWDNDTPAKAFNLANHDIYGNEHTGHDPDNLGVPWETANCYIVSAPGWYCLPIVYGNGYKNGHINTAAFKNTATGEYLMKGTFQRGSWAPAANYGGGADIRGPWILRYVNETFNGESNVGDQIDKRQTKLVWEDVDGMIIVPGHNHAPGETYKDKDGNDQAFLERGQAHWDNSDYKAHYLYFYVDKDHMAHGGNAVVAVGDGGGNVVWSWHIWVVPKSRLEHATQTVWYYPEPSRQKFSYSSSGLTIDGMIDGDPTLLASNEMMDMNLGYVAGIQQRSCLIRFRQEGSGKEGMIYVIQKGDASTAGAVHYQWGRKDPMWTVALDALNYGKDIYWYHQNGNWSNTPVTRTSDNLMIENFASSTYTDAESWIDYGTDRALNRTIRRPEMFAQAPNGRYLWSQKRYDNLWDMSITAPNNDESGHDGPDHEVIKTIYDPCPPGFKVPNEYAFTGFNKKGIDVQVPASTDPANPADPEETINGLNASFYIGQDSAESQGMWLYCHPTDKTKGLMFFPALGRRSGFNGGQISGMFEEGMYWTAAPFQSNESGPGTGGNGYARTFHMRRNDNSFDPTNSPQCFPVYTRAAAPENQPYTGYIRTHAMQVRPIRDVPPTQYHGSLGPGIQEGKSLYGSINLN